ncbi:hypothetical protein SDC9_193785 [bioreactor metagenome]|uniref:Uncharacterized protein n=1 Tax=bioreactor metagenome TaxID=1076179 RepID=A0A645I5Y3_9ZZZZ
MIFGKCTVDGMVKMNTEKHVFIKRIEIIRDDIISGVYAPDDLIILSIQIVSSTKWNMSS